MNEKDKATEQEAIINECIDRMYIEILQCVNIETNKTKLIQTIIESKVRLMVLKLNNK